MPIKPSDAGKPTQKELQEVDYLWTFIDEYLVENYQGPPHECTIVLAKDIPVRAVKFLAQTYRDLGWKVEYQYSNFSTLVFSEE